MDLRDVIEARFGVSLQERTVGERLHRLGFGKLSVRPAQPQGGAQASKVFKENFAVLGKQALPSKA